MPTFPLDQGWARTQSAAAAASRAWPLAQSRTPSVGARYSTFTRGMEPERALQEVSAALPNANPQWALRRAVMELGGAGRVGLGG